MYFFFYTYNIRSKFISEIRVITKYIGFNIKDF